MQARLNHRIALVFLLVCPFGCSPAAQQKLSWPLAANRPEKPAATEQSGESHAHHHHHHHAVAHQPSADSPSSHSRQYPERLASAHGHESAPHRFGLTDFTTASPDDAEEPTPIEDPSAAGEVDGASSHADPEKLMELPAQAGGNAPIASGDANASQGSREYAHAQDYSWVQGRLEYRHRTHQWRIRYAPHWLEDQYGGSFVLAGDEHPSWKEGDWVRVAGAVQDPSSTGDANYQVDRTEVLQSESPSEQ